MFQMNIIYIKRRLGVGEQGDSVEIRVLDMDTTWLEIKWLNIKDMFVVPVLIGFADQGGGKWEIDWSISACWGMGQISKGDTWGKDNLHFKWSK